MLGGSKAPPITFPIITALSSTESLARMCLMSSCFLPLKCFPFLRECFPQIGHSSAVLRFICPLYLLLNPSCYLIPAIQQLSASLSCYSNVKQYLSRTKLFNLDFGSLVHLSSPVFLLASLESIRRYHLLVAFCNLGIPHSLRDNKDCTLRYFLQRL